MVENNKKEEGTGPGTEDTAKMLVMIRNVGVALVISLIAWAANGLQKATVTIAEIQRDVLNLDKQVQKDLSVINNRVIDLKSEFRDFKNEQRSNTNQSPGSRWGPLDHGNPGVAPQLFRGDPAGSGGGGIRDSSLHGGDVGGQLSDRLPGSQE